MTDKKAREYLVQCMKLYEIGKDLYECYNNPSCEKEKIWYHIDGELCKDYLKYNIAHGRLKVISYNNHNFTVAYYTYDYSYKPTMFTVITKHHKYIYDLVTELVYQY